MASKFELDRTTTVHVIMSNRKYCKLDISVPYYPYSSHSPKEYPREKMRPVDSKRATVTLYRDEETGIFVDDIGKFEKWIERLGGVENESQA